MQQSQPSQPDAGVRVATAPEPAHPMASPARVKAASVYPRPGWLRIIRAALRRWWLTTTIIVATVTQTLIQTFLTKGAQGVGNELDFSVIGRTTFIGQLATHHPFLFWLGAAILALLVPVGIYAERDYQAEKRFGDEARARRQQEEIIQEALEVTRETPVSASFTAPLDIETLAHASTFIDRTETRHELTSLLTAAQPGAVYGVEGMKGVGKTSLTYACIRQAYASGVYSDGVAALDCTNTTDVNALLAALISKVAGKSAVGGATTLQELRDTAFKALKGRKLLVALDNVEPGLALRDLLAPLKAAGCVTIFTAAFRIPAQLCTRDFQLPLLDLRYGLEVFAANLGRDYTPAEEPHVRSMVERVGRHTLAIVVIARYAAETARSLPALDVELSNLDVVLDLDVDDATSTAEARGALASAFMLSYRELPENAQRLFQALGAMPTPSYERGAALEIAQRLAVSNGRQALDVLIRRALLEQSRAGADDVERIAQHSLLYAFAREVQDTAMRDHATSAIIDYYCAFCEAHADDFAALNQEYDNIRGALQSVIQRMDAHPDAMDTAHLVARYLRVLAPFFNWYGHNQDGLEYTPAGIRAAERIGDSALVAQVSLAYGRGLRNLGKFDEAQSYYSRALAIARQTKDAAVEVLALERLADLAHGRDQLDESLALRKQLVERTKAAGDMREYTHTMIDVAHVLIDEDRLDEADPYLVEALKVAREQPQPLVAMEAFALLMQGMSARKRGQWNQATELDIHSMELFSSVGELGSVGGCLEELGQTANARGDRATAVKHWNEAVQIYQRMGIARADYVKDKLIGAGAAGQSGPPAPQPDSQTQAAKDGADG